MDSDLEYLIPTKDDNDYEIISKYLTTEEYTKENLKRRMTRMFLKIKKLIHF